MVALTKLLLMLVMVHVLGGALHLQKLQTVLSQDLDSPKATNVPATLAEITSAADDSLAKKERKISISYLSDTSFIDESSNLNHRNDTNAPGITDRLLTRDTYKYKNNTDPEYDKIPVVAQKYPTLGDTDIGPGFLLAHQRWLNKSAVKQEGEIVQICQPCIQSSENGLFLSCDDLVGYGYTCTESETRWPSCSCNKCQCSCENLCNNGKSCNEMIKEDPSLTCTHLEHLYGCNCRGCELCEGRCTHKCSMRDTNIKGSYGCETWYKMDPKYTVRFLKDHAVVTGTEDQPCTCDGCNGADALSYCANDTPYDESDVKSKYMDIETAKVLGKVEKMRITIVDDFVDLKKCKNNEFCAKYNCLPGDVGKVINNCEFNGNRDNCLVQCKEEDIMTEEKSFTIRHRFEWLKKFMADALSLKPVRDPIELYSIRPFVTEMTNRYYDNTDLVIVLTMMPECNDAIAGSAVPLQKDQWNRITAGWFNLVPKEIDVSFYKQEKNKENLKRRQKAELLLQKAKLRRLILREALHLIGGLYSDPSNYINKYGKEPCAHQIYIDKDWEGHRVRKLRTPKVLALAREQFACSSLSGMPMEDHLIGKGNHWRTPCYGPKILSYGHDIGESHLSNLTLAYLEDTGHYVANYSRAGWLIPHAVSVTAVASALIPLKHTHKSSQKIPLSPGFKLWARQEGCNLVALGDLQSENNVCLNKYTYDSNLGFFGNLGWMLRSNLGWIFFGILVVAAIIAILITFACWKRCCKYRIHFCCGVHQEQENWDKILESRHGKYSCTGYILTIVGAIWAIAGATLIIFALYSAATASSDVKQIWDGQTRVTLILFFLGAFILVVSIMGVEGAWSNHPSIWLILYFYVCVFVFMDFLAIPIVPFVLSDEDLWLAGKNGFSYVSSDLDNTAAMDHFANSTLHTYKLWIIFLGLVCIVSVIVGIVCSILMLTVRVVMWTFEVVMNSMLFVIGFGLTIYAMVYFWYLDAYIRAIAIVPALVLVLVGFIGIVAACQRYERFFVNYTWQFTAIVFFVVGIVATCILVSITTPPREDTPACFELEGVPVMCDGAAGMCCSCFIRKEYLSDINAVANSSFLNASRRALAVESFTQCEHSCKHVPGYSCTEVKHNVTPPAPTEVYPLMKIDPYIRSLGNGRIGEIISIIACPEPISMFGLDSLIAWATLDLRVFAILLFACCVSILLLLIVLRVIICCEDLEGRIVIAPPGRKLRRGGLLIRKINKTTTIMGGPDTIISRTIASNGATRSVGEGNTTTTFVATPNTYSRLNGTRIVEEGNITNTRAAGNLAAGNFVTNLTANTNTTLVKATTDTTRPGMMKRIKKSIKRQFMSKDTARSVAKGNITNTRAAGNLATNSTANANTTFVNTTDTTRPGAITRIKKSIKRQFMSKDTTRSVAKGNITNTRAAGNLAAGNFVTNSITDATTTFVNTTDTTRPGAINRAKESIKRQFMSKDTARSVAKGNITNTRAAGNLATNSTANTNTTFVNTTDTTRPGAITRIKKSIKRQFMSKDTTRSVAKGNITNTRAAGNLAADKLVTNSITDANTTLVKATTDTTRPGAINRTKQSIKRQFMANDAARSVAKGNIITNTRAAGNLATNSTANANTTFVNTTDTTRPGAITRIKNSIKRQFMSKDTTRSVAKGNITNTRAAGNLAAGKLVTNSTTNVNTTLVKVTGTTRPGAINRAKQSIKRQFMANDAARSVAKGNIITNTRAAGNLVTNSTANANTTFVNATDTTRPGVITRIKKSISRKFMPDVVNTSTTEKAITTDAGGISKSTT